MVRLIVCGFLQKTATATTTKTSGGAGAGGSGSGSGKTAGSGVKGKGGKVTKKVWLHHQLCSALFFSSPLLLFEFVHVFASFGFLFSRFLGFFQCILN